MPNKWISLAVALVLLAGAALAGAATTQDAKATAVPAASGAPGKAPTAKPPATAKKKLVNLNAASRQELKGLPGGSDEEAARIIAGRPYNSKAFLVTDQVISMGRYTEIKALVVAGEPAKPAARAAESGQTPLLGYMASDSGVYGSRRGKRRSKRRADIEPRQGRQDR